MSSMDAIEAVGASTTAELIRRAVWAMPHLPFDGDGRYDTHALTAAWLIEQKPRTRRAYFRDLARWLDWCHDHTVDTLTARPTDVGQYRSGLEDNLAPSSVARAMSGASSWYTYLVANGHTAANPFAAAKRPKVNRDVSTTIGLTLDEARRLIAAAAAMPGRTRLRNHALIMLLASTGLRIGEALSLDVNSLGSEEGFRVIRFTGKGNRKRRRPLPGPTVHAIETYLADREARGIPVVGPLFATEHTTGSIGRMSEPAAFLLVRQLATAIPTPNGRPPRLSPHSLRHFFVTDSRRHGDALEDVQDALDHADPRTTRRYDRDRHRLERDPALSLGLRLA